VKYHRHEILLIEGDDEIICMRHLLVEAERKKYIPVSLTVIQREPTVQVLMVVERGDA
jgi:hypothetical protein